MDGLGFKKDRYVFASAPSMMVLGDGNESNKIKQISLFLNELNTYNVLLKDLVNFPLRENDRNISLNVAYYIISDEEILQKVIEKKDLPIGKLSKLTRLKPEYLEKLRDYILAYYIVLNNPYYKSLQDSLRIKLKEDNNVINISNKNEKIHKGLAVKLVGRAVYILTSKGEFFKIKTSDKVSVGEIAEGKEKRFFRNYRIHISILLFVLILIGSGIIIQYRTTQSTIVIETSSNIKIHINKFNKVIYMYSPTEKGKELINNIDVENKDVDEAISKTFEYAVKNQMIDLSKKTLMTISGQPLKYGTLIKTNKVISENKVPIIINNSGNQQNLPKDQSEDETKK